jgi:hypothetical protein
VTSDGGREGGVFDHILVGELDPDDQNIKRQIDENSQNIEQGIA